MHFPVWFPEKAHEILMEMVKATDYVLKLYIKTELKRVVLTLQSKVLQLGECHSRGVHH